MKDGVKKIRIGNRCLTIKTKKIMKKNLFMVAAVALMAMVSCNKEEVNQSGPEVAPEPSYYVEFTAQIDNEETPAPSPAQAQTQTRTAYDKTNNTTKWIDGDLISVNGKKFRIKELAADGLSATFINAEELGEDFGAPFTAIYPYNATEGSAVVPSTQTVTDGTFADESVVTVAYSAENNTLSFKHVTSVVKFQVATEGVSELTFSSSVALAGTISVNANEGGEPTYEATAGSKTITVKPASGTFSVGETYYVSVLPTVGEAGTKVDFAIKTEGVTVKSGNVNFKRNIVMDAKTIEVKYVRLSPSSCWLYGGTRFAVNMFNASYNEWHDLKGSGKGYYQCVVPEHLLDATVIFCRMNPNTTENNWTNRWNQTADLTMPTAANNCYRINENSWDSGKWSNISYKTLYLKPNSNWLQSKPKFAAYFYSGSNNEWVTMMDSDKDGYYECLNTSSYGTVIFVRLDADESDDSGHEEYNTWDAKWNQTGNLTVPTNSNNLYTINSGSWDAGKWSVK